MRARGTRTPSQEEIKRTRQGQEEIQVVRAGQEKIKRGWFGQEEITRSDISQEKIKRILIRQDSKIKTLARGRFNNRVYELEEDKINGKILQKQVSFPQDHPQEDA